MNETLSTARRQSLSDDCRLAPHRVVTFNRTATKTLGGSGGISTHSFLLKRQALCQLSYRSITQILTGLVGVEPDDLSVDSAAATPLAHSPVSSSIYHLPFCIFQLSLVEASFFNDK
jgi:hypothetical protein